MKPLMRVWRWVRWPVGVLVLVYIALVLYRIPAVGEKERTKDAVAYIHAQKITLSDVMGSNLPPPPNKQENDATVEGVDANNNGVRDDVELAIFEKYPDSPRVRAAQLQYAMALQMELTRVFNSEILVAVLQEKSRASLCLTTADLAVNHLDNTEAINSALMIGDKRKQEVETLVVNTDMRDKKQEEVFEKYMTSYGDMAGPECDLEI